MLTLQPFPAGGYRFISHQFVGMWANNLPGLTPPLHGVVRYPLAMSRIESHIARRVVRTGSGIIEALVGVNARGIGRLTSHPRLRHRLTRARDQPGRGRGTVRRIFALYRELGCVRRVKEGGGPARAEDEATHDGWWPERGGTSFSRGHIYQLLATPIYTGRIAHKGQLYPGQQPPLIEDETWTAVRQQLAANAGHHRRRPKAVAPSLLTSLLVDARGERLTPSHAAKKGRRGC